MEGSGTCSPGYLSISKARATPCSKRPCSGPTCHDCLSFSGAAFRPPQAVGVSSLLSYWGTPLRQTRFKAPHPPHVSTAGGGDWKQCQPSGRNEKHLTSTEPEIAQCGLQGPKTDRLILTSKSLLPPAKGKQATEEEWESSPLLQEQQPPRAQRRHFPFQPHPAWKSWDFRSLGFLPQGQLQSTGLSCLLKTLASLQAVRISSSTQSLLASTPKVILRSSKG